MFPTKYYISRRPKIKKGLLVHVGSGADSDEDHGNII